MDRGLVMDWLRPMLAKAVPEDFDPAVVSVVAEPKLDGHRHLIKVHEDGTVEAWSRILRDAMKKMDDEMRADLSKWQPGIYDGELDLGYGYSSSDVALIRKRGDLRFIAFDRLTVMHGTRIWDMPYHVRRVWLERGVVRSDRVDLVPTWTCNNRWQMRRLVEREWQRGGEGVMLKQVEAPYYPGKRSLVFGKIKECKSKVVTIVKYWPPTEGSDTEYGVVSVMDDDGVRTSVKILNHRERDYCRSNADAIIGRKLAIEYQKQLPGGAYRHPRWDHWA